MISGDPRLLKGRGRPPLLFPDGPKIEPGSLPLPLLRSSTQIRLISPSSGDVGLYLLKVFLQSSFAFFRSQIINPLGFSPGGELLLFPQLARLNSFRSTATFVLPQQTIWGSARQPSLGSEIPPSLAQLFFFFFFFSEAVLVFPTPPQNQLRSFGFGHRGKPPMRFSFSELWGIPDCPFLLLVFRNKNPDVFFFPSRFALQRAGPQLGRSS